MGERKRDKEFECIASKLELCGRRVESITFFSSTMKFYFFPVSYILQHLAVVISNAFFMVKTL